MNNLKNRLNFIIIPFFFSSGRNFSLAPTAKASMRWQALVNPHPNIASRNIASDEFLVRYEILVYVSVVHQEPSEITKTVQPLLIFQLEI